MSGSFFVAFRLQMDAVAGASAGAGVFADAGAVAAAGAGAVAAGLARATAFAGADVSAGAASRFQIRQKHIKKGPPEAPKSKMISQI